MNDFPHDWNNIKNTDDKYNKTAMKIRKFRYNVMDDVKPFIKPHKWTRYSTDGKWVLTQSLTNIEENG